MKTKILYLSYNGMMEPLGVSQVLSYVERLCNEYEFHLVSVEKRFKESAELSKLEGLLKEKGIYYYPLEYKSGKISKNFNLLKLLLKANQLIVKENIKFVHCRAYFPTIVTLLLKKKYPIKYLFDTRSFGFDERADTDMISRNGWLYKILKKIEKKLYVNASGVNMLSYEGKRMLESNELFDGANCVTPISVIPTCVDLDKFLFSKKQFREPLKIGYVGNTVGWYDFDKTLKVIKEIGKAFNYKFHIFNDGQHAFIMEKIKKHGIPEQRVIIESVPFKEMPEKLNEIDLSIFYIRPLFSKKASAATKLGEFLASGIPVITNSNVGDHEFYVEGNQTGLILNFDNLQQYDFKDLLPTILNRETSVRCREVAEKFFSAEQGAIEYKKIYTKIFA